MTKTINMTKGQPWKLLVAFALPLMFGNIFQQLYTMVDTAIFAIRVGIALAVGFTGYQNGIFGAEVMAWIGSVLFLMVNYYKTMRKEVTRVAK